MRSSLQASFRLFFYLLLVLFPLIVGAIFRPVQASASALVNFSAALGYIGFSIMALELILVSRFEGALWAFGLDALQMFHKMIGIFALALVLVHPLALVAAGYPWRMALPGATVPWAIPLGTLALVATLVLIVLSVWRRALKISYERWQLTHSLLTIALLLLAAVHILLAGRYAQTAPMRATIVLYLTLLAGLFLYYRMIKPRRRLRQPWTVVENRVELGDSRTLRLQPEGHPGWGFESGQFAWINLHPSPFSFEQHPISMSSCGDLAAETGEIAFTIKDLGDWSGQRVAAAKPGDRVWLDGPYGVFTLDAVPAPGYVFLAGGVGITPLYAMLSTMANREDTRPALLFFGAPNLESLILREEVLALEKRMNLKVVLVLSRPAAGWQGETGYIRAELLHKYLPASEKIYRRWEYIICGPSPMIDAMEQTLPEMGVPLQRIHAERFDMV